MLCGLEIQDVAAGPGDSGPVGQEVLGMICPLISMGKIQGVILTDCQKDLCAWWDAEYRQCAILTLAQGMSRRADAKTN